MIRSPFNPVTMKKIQILLLLLFCANGLQSFSQELVSWRGPGRDGIFPETGLLKIWPEGGPHLVWHFDGLGEGHSSAAVTSDRVFVTGVTNGIGYLFSFDNNGKLLWKIPFGEDWTESYPGCRTTPLIYDGKVYLLSGMGKLVCRSATDGALVWTIDLLKDYQAPNIRWGITENLLIDGEKLFCTPGGNEYNVIALDKNTGKLIWKCAAKGEASAYCSPALIEHGGRKILVTQTASSIIGIDASKGTFLWSIDQPNTWSVHANTPLYHDGLIYCVSGYGKGGVQLRLSPDGNKVTEVWRNTAIGNRMGGAVLLNGKLYGSDDNGKAWHCVDWKTGVTMFSEKITGKGNIISADNMLYCYGENGEVILARPDGNSFTKVSAFKVPYGTDQHWAHLVIDNGKLYIRHGNSLMVYDIRKK